MIRRTMSVQRALEWAFADEKAQIDFDVTGKDEFARVGTDMIWRAMQDALVGCKVDGGGTSDPSVDAQIIASIVESVLDPKTALDVVMWARARACPNWLPQGARSFVYPLQWDYDPDGRMVGQIDHGPRTPYRDEKGRARHYRPSWVPVRCSYSAAVLDAARMAYLDWVEALGVVALALRQRGLLETEITAVLPVPDPWNARKIA